MTIQNFELRQPERELTKGIVYFKRNRIKSLEETEPGTWKAIVRGREDYIVEIEIKNNEITDVCCGCSKDAPYCKHIIAVLYGIREKSGATSYGNTVIKKEKNSSAKTFNDIVNDTPEAALRRFIIEHANNDQEFKNMFLTHFMQFFFTSPQT